MKLQRQFTHKVNGKEYHKYVIVIPEEIIDKSEFKEGDELEAEVKKGEIRLRKV